LTGYKCGSIYIDLAFKKWLFNVLGEDIYKEYLDPKYDGEIHSHAAEGDAMRKIMKEFNAKKKRFKNGRRDVTIELPSPLDALYQHTGGLLPITE
jgi:hypothetical protein